MSRISRMCYESSFIVRQVLLAMDHPEDRLCAADEWREILLSWIEECTFEDRDRFYRLHAILQRCLYAT